MKTVICLDKEDITTTRIGNNIWVNVNDQFSISLTREALDELIKDYNQIVDAEKAETECNAHPFRL